MASNVDFLSQLADYLEQQGIGNSTTGDINIFAGKQPSDPDNCIALLGLIGSFKPDVSIPELEYPRFQIIVRNLDYEAASMKMRQVRNALHDKLTVVTPNFVCLYIQAEQDGYPIGEDSKGRAEFSINFTSEIRYHDSGS